MTASNLTDKELADRVRDNWLQIKQDAIDLGWRGYKTRVSLLSYKTWCNFELSHFQTMSQNINITKCESKVTEL